MKISSIGFKSARDTRSESVAALAATPRIVRLHREL